MNIFITGASQGLGKEISLHFLQKGENVFGFSINEFNYQDESFERYIQGKKFIHFCGSLINVENIINAVEKFYNTFGNLDILINNAGIKHQKIPEEISNEEYINVINTNLTYQIILTQTILKKMIQIGKGKIINISSRSGMEYYDTGTAYCSSKSGLIAYSISLSKYLKKYNISVNVISPKTISTEDYKMLKPELDHKKFVKVESILKILNYIIYNKKFISGKNFPVFSFKSLIRNIILDLMKYFDYIKQMKLN
jgi:3-oxoacyl-[acyl-carrier protein] reductase